MRCRIIIAALSALFAATPALADITARYWLGANSGMTMTIRANQRGDSRIDTDNQMAVLTIDGATYVVMADLLGVYSIRMEDLLAAMGARFRAMVGESNLPTPPPADAPAYDRRERGTEAIAGYSGIVWVFTPPRRDGEPPPPPGGGLEFVISTDPELAPIGRALARAMESSSSNFDSAIGLPGLSFRPLADVLRQVTARGTIIRMSRIMQLESVDEAPVPPSLFTLPGPTLSPEQLAERRGWTTQLQN